jgi:hypothetical protein
MPSIFTYSDGSTSESLNTTITSSSYSIPSGQSLVSVSIGANATSIGDNAFQDASGLTSITISAGVTSIGSYAFNGATNLTSVTFAEGSQLTSIGYQAFNGATSLTSITIPASVTNIGDYAFLAASSLASVTFEDGSHLTSIGRSAFKDTTSLSSITIPEGVTNIGNTAFMNASSLTSITVDQSNNNFKAIDGVLFDFSGARLIQYPLASSVSNYEIPASVTSIGSNVFFGASSLTSVTFAEGSQLTSIGYQAFNGATSLTSITIPASVTNIGSYAFMNASSLTSIIIPEGVTSIGSYAFMNASSLTSIIIPEGVTSIGNTAFMNASSLTSITIPASVTSIGLTAFYGTTSLTSVTFAEGSQLTSIGSYAFYGTTSLTSITIPEGVINIGELAFNSSGLNIVYIENGQVINGDSISSPSPPDTVVSFFGANVIIQLPAGNEPEPEPEPSTVWVKKIKSSPDGWDGAYNMDIDSNNNIYVVVALYADITFAGQTLEYTGNIPNALLKYDSNGNEVWGKVTPGVTDPWDCDITISSNNEVYITTYTSTTITFANEIITHTEGNGSEIVLYKYDSDGNEIWAKMIGGTGHDGGLGVTTDSNNNVYLVGYARNAIIFANQTLTLTDDGNWDCIIFKYDSNGNEIWGRNLGGLGFDSFKKVKIDSLDNIYVIGSVNTSMTFAGQTYTSTTPKPTSDGGELIIVKYDSNGNEIWGKMYECFSTTSTTSPSVMVMSITLDSNNNLYITGGLRGSITFANQTITSNPGSSDAYIFKLDSNGNDIWIKRYGNGINQATSSVTSAVIDSNNKLFFLANRSNATTFGNITTEPLGPNDTYSFTQ